MDSGCDQHMCRDKALFSHLTNCSPVYVSGIAGQSLVSTACGTVRIDRPDKPKGNKSIILKDVLFVPDLRYNLIAIRQLSKDGYWVAFQNGKCAVGKPNEGRFVLDPVGRTNVFVLRAHVDSGDHYGKLYEWHCKLGHCGWECMSKVIADENVFPGISMNALKRAWNKGVKCKACQLGKFANGPFQLSASRASHTFQLIHTDLVGPIKPESYYKS